MTNFVFTTRLLAYVECISLEATFHIYYFKKHDINYDYK